MTTHLSRTGSPPSSSHRKLSTTASDLAVRGVVRDESIVESGSRLTGVGEGAREEEPEGLGSGSSLAFRSGFESWVGAMGEGPDDDPACP